MDTKNLHFINVFQFSMDHDRPPNMQRARFVNAFNNDNNAALRDLIRRLLHASTQAINLQEWQKLKNNFFFHN